MVISFQRTQLLLQKEYLKWGFRLKRPPCFCQDHTTYCYTTAACFGFFRYFEVKNKQHNCVEGMPLISIWTQYALFNYTGPLPPITLWNSMKLRLEITLWQTPTPSTIWTKRDAAHNSQQNLYAKCGSRKMHLTAPGHGENVTTVGLEIV
jgi:hypothetical protein